MPRCAQPGEFSKPCRRDNRTTDFDADDLEAGGGLLLPPHEKGRLVDLIRVEGTAIAWNTRCVQVRWSGTNPEPVTAWVWAFAVPRI